jgi:2-amino-4-hydroxy-6-hydroxymethyldihydropteridine diphosphokinase
MVKAFLALGTNLRSEWGNAAETLLRAIDLLQLAGCRISAISPTYKSISLVPGQPVYANLALAVIAPMSVGALLRTAKDIERRAGRRTRAKWSARPLDIDIIMAGSICYNWPHRSTGRLTLPHPEAHRRAFVLKPLSDISPRWHHPGLNATSTQLFNRLPLSVRTRSRSRRNPASKVSQHGLLR